MKELVELEEEMLKYRGKRCLMSCWEEQKDGFADRYIAMLIGCRERRSGRSACNGSSDHGACPVSGVHDAAYYYSTYNAPDSVQTSSRRKILSWAEDRTA